MAMSNEQFWNEIASPWMREDGPDDDIVLSTRVRLARNFQDVPFPNRMSTADGEKILTRLISGYHDQGTSIGKFSLIKMADLAAGDRRVLLEKHLISPQLADGESQSACLLSEQEEISVMVNEEDHLRIQCLYPGLQLTKALETAIHMDSWLEGAMPYAFDSQIGFLTSCPSNVGTGLRASVMMHLPGLAISRKLEQIIQSISKMGLVVRGIYGEGSKSFANLYQVSNQITLGKSEHMIIEDLQNVVNQIVVYEREVRKSYLEAAQTQVEDQVFRALGVLRNARLISSMEAGNTLSQVRVGIDEGLISDIPTKLFNELIIAVQPGCLEKLAGKALTAEERDQMRASLLRENFMSYSG